MARRLACWISWTILGLGYWVPTASGQDARKPVRLSVDLREASKYIFHAKLLFPVSAGPLTLVYPKWIPGEHAPVGTDCGFDWLAFSRGRERDCVAAG